MMSLSRDQKQELRRVALKRRESYCRARIVSWGELIQDRAMGHRTYRAAGAVALYSPIGNEVPTHRICGRALASGRGVFYPKLGGVIGSLVKIESEKDLRPCRYGMLEPKGSRCVSQEELCGLVVFVPAVLLDQTGNRLGRGGGWYDRALTSLGKDVIRIALAYEFQLIEEVPTDKWDCSVDFIMTEDRVIRCGSEA